MVSRSVAGDPTQTAQNGGRRRWSIQRGAPVGPMALGGFGSRYGMAAELWWAAVDSNHVPPRYQHGALPVELAAQGLGMHGRGGRIRTLGPRFWRPML